MLYLACSPEDLRVGFSVSPTQRRMDHPHQRQASTSSVLPNSLNVSFSLFCAVVPAKQSAINSKSEVAGIAKVCSSVLCL